MRAPPLLVLENVRRRYLVGGSPVEALDGVSLTIGAGEFVAITGASGSGKSTLMHILGCLDLPTAGRYRLNSRDVTDGDDARLARFRNRAVGFVFQEAFLFPRLTALENVAQPLVYRGTPPAQRQARARAALEAVGLGARLGHRPSQLSGGQRQRVAIARALVGQPALLLADEPTGSLDSRSAEEIIRLFAAVHAGGQTVVLVTHDPGIAARAPRRIVLRDGQVAADSGGGGP